MKRMSKVKTWRDLYERAEKDVRYQKLIIASLKNLGCEHLAEGHHHHHYKEPWQKSYFGLQDYISALVGEYVKTEDKAERSVLAEVNSVLFACRDEFEKEEPAAT